MNLDALRGVSTIEHVTPALPGTWRWSIYGTDGKRSAARDPVIGWLVITREDTDPDGPMRWVVTTPIIPGNDQQVSNIWTDFIEMPDGLCYVDAGETYRSIGEALKDHGCPWPEHIPRPEVQRATTAIEKLYAEGGSIRIVEP